MKLQDKSEGIPERFQQTSIGFSLEPPTTLASGKTTQFDPGTFPMLCRGVRTSWVYGAFRRPIDHPSEFDSIEGALTAYSRIAMQMIGRFQILEHLGSGGMGSVVRAYDPSLGRDVAIKLLNPGLLSDPDFTARFLREAQSAAKLSHANIVTIHDLVAGAATAYIVMELIRGRNLDQLLQARVLPVQERLAILRDIADALDYAHSCGVLHRDVKPQNIMVREDGTVKLTDFGIAKSLTSDQLTQTGSLVGTPAYIPPEALRDQEWGVQGDQYSLAVVAYQILLGRKPFAMHDGSMSSLFHAILTKEPPLLRDFDQEFPNDAYSVLLKGLSKNPADRFHTCSKFVDILTSAIGNYRPDTSIGLHTDTQWSHLNQAGDIDGLRKLLRRYPDYRYKDAVEARIAELQRNVQRPESELRCAAPESPAVRPSSSEMPQSATASKAGTQPPPFASAAAPTSEPSFTQMFRAPAPPTAPSAPAGSPRSQPPSSEPSFTQIFRAPAPPTAPSAPAGSPRSQPPSSEPSFTQMFQAPAPPAAPTAPNGPSHAQPLSPECSFTQMFAPEPRSSEPDLNPATARPDRELASTTSAFETAPPPSAPVTAGEEFTQMFPGRHPPSSVQLSDFKADVSLIITHCLDPKFLGRRFDLTAFPFRIGRLQGDLQIAFDSAVSNDHAAIEFRDGGFYICDNGSSNGTFLNGRRIGPGRFVPLSFGTTISLGSNLILQFTSVESTELPDLTGIQIRGRYVLLRKLHATGKAVVYLAEDQSLGRSVAMKILSPRLARYSGYREQFLLAARAASRFEHPHICSIFDSDQAVLPPQNTETVFLCSRYLPGGSLAARLEQRELPAIHQLADWITRLCGALDYLHTRGHVHGGIKPSAIVFDAEQNPFLSDFAISGAQASELILGTPAYLAWEQWDGQEATAASDIYSLAAVAYRAITGALPFEGQDHPAVRHRNSLQGPLDATLAAASSGRPPVDLRVAAVLAKALSINSADRFSSAHEFAKEFLAATQKEVHAPTVFISYHRNTCSTEAYYVETQLRDQYGFDVFSDSRLADKPGRFAVEIEEKISRCDAFLCLLDSSALQSYWVKREVRLALRLADEKLLIPVFIDDFRPEQRDAGSRWLQKLLKFQGVPLHRRDKTLFDAAISSIAGLIRSVRNYRHRNA